MNRYVISPEASRDLDRITDYFVSCNIDAGERFIKEFNKKCKNLLVFPNMGRIYAEIEPSLRGIPLDDYIILYRVIGDGIEVVRVVNGYRDLGALFSNSDDR